MTKPEAGTIWQGQERDQFRVLDVVDLEGHTWVHYCRVGETEPREYSCYIESFLSRFTAVINDQRTR